MAIINPMMCETGTLRDLQDQNRAAERKLDGTRGWGIQVDEDTRSILGNPRDRGISTDYTDRLAEIRDAMAGIPAGSYILDMEIVYFDDKGRSIFKGSQKRCSTQDPIKQREYMRLWPVQAMAFDLLELDGKDLRNFPWETRKRMLKDLLEESLQRNIIPEPHVIEDKERYFHAVVSRGEEGVIAKLLRGRYEEGRRSRSWLKVKNWNYERCLVVGWTPGRGSREGLFRSLILAQPGPDGRLKYMGKVGSGFSSAEVRKIFALLRGGEVDDRLVEAQDSKGVIDYQPVSVDIEIKIQFRETSEFGVFKMPSVAKDNRKRNLIYYGQKTISGKPQTGDLMAILKELAEEK